MVFLSLTIGRMICVTARERPPLMLSELQVRPLDDVRCYI